MRTLVDLASLLTLEALVCALDAALHRRLITTSDLHDAVAGRTGRRRGPALRRAVALADGRAESPPETLGRLLLPVLPGLVPQVRVRAGGRVVARLDLGDEALLLGVEMDGRRGHAGSAMIAKDRRRDAPVTRLGWEVERGTWWDVRCGQPAFVERVLRGADRQRRLRPGG